jgi:hypothetical protein
MSERSPVVPAPPPASPPAPQPPPQRDGCATAFMLIAGIILLLPGVLCVMLLSAFKASGNDPFSVGSFLLAGCGIALILYAVLRKRS